VTASTLDRTIPVATGKGVLGVSRGFQTRPLETLREVFDEHGDFVRVRFFGNQYFYLLSHPDAIRHVFATNARNYTKAPHPAFTLLSHVMGQGLVTSDGELWGRQRRLIQPAFTPQRVAQYGELMTTATLAMLDRWHARGGALLNVDAEMMRLTLDIVGQTLFGQDLTASVSHVGTAFTAVSAQFARLLGSPLGPVAIRLPFLPGTRRFRGSVAALDVVVNGIIAERRHDGRDTGDLLSLLLAARDQDGVGMDDRQLRDEVMTLLLSGHETTADALTWALHLIDRHPEVRENLESEVDSVLGGRVATVDDLPRLAYTEMVVREALRLYPPIFLYARWGNRPDLVGRYGLPADATITVCPYVVHRHPEFWPHPDRFDPERFTPERIAAREHYAWIPFSGGPRQCVGVHFAMMEAQLLLATIVQHCRLTLAPGRTVVPGPAMTLRPHGGLPMHAHSRIN
jgi:cytochrome P450